MDLKNYKKALITGATSFLGQELASMLANQSIPLALAIGNGWLPHFFSARLSNRTIILSSITGFSLFLILTLFIDSKVLIMIFFGLLGLFIGLTGTLMTVNISNSASDSIQVS